MRTLDGIGELYAGMFGLHGIGGAPGHLLAYIAASAALVWGLPEEWRWPVERWNARVGRSRRPCSSWSSRPPSTPPIRFIYFRF